MFEQAALKPLQVVPHKEMDSDKISIDNFEQLKNFITSIIWLRIVFFLVFVTYLAGLAIKVISVIIFGERLLNIFRTQSQIDEELDNIEPGEVGSQANAHADPY